MANLLSVAEAIQKNMGVIDGSPYIYNGCYWEAFNSDLIQCFISEVAKKSGYNEFQAQKDSTKTMLMKQFITTATVFKSKPNSERIMINLLNGTFVYENGSYWLEEFKQENLLTYQLKFEYNPKAEAPKYMAFLDEVMPNKEAQNIMAEYFGYIFAKQCELRVEYSIYEKDSSEFSEYKSY